MKHTPANLIPLLAFGGLMAFASISTADVPAFPVRKDTAQRRRVAVVGASSR